MATNDGRCQWGRRTVTYFAYDPVIQQFAPAKFCAYAIHAGETKSLHSAEMTIAAYSALDKKEPCFDGTKARHHLTKRLAMEEISVLDRPEVERCFFNWISPYHDHVSIHPSGPKFLLPPRWFR